jgi:hypothetical protein
MAHEYGHALGLGHSANGGATMAPSTSAGSTTPRSIAGDDVLGIQCIYGVASATKPVITATVASAGTLTIHGSQFGATGNEVWFTNANVTTSGSDPIVRVTSVTSTGGGTLITVTIPAAAAPGDVLVNKSGTGGATLSNAFPTDLVGTFGIPPGPRPDITSVTPSTIDALIPGTDQTIVITGTNLDLTTDLQLDGGSIAASRYTIVNATTITLDMPQASTLGSHNLGVTDGVVTDTFGVTIVAPALPKYELGNGDPLNVVNASAGMSFIVSGVPGRLHRVYASLSNLPSNNSRFSLDIGNGFTNLYNGGQYVIPASGWVQINVPSSALPVPIPGGILFYSQTAEILLPAPYDDSNLQSILMLP